jgi:hypothetical protein
MTAQLDPCVLSGDILLALFFSKKPLAIHKPTVFGRPHINIYSKSTKTFDQAPISMHNTGLRLKKNEVSAQS